MRVVKTDMERNGLMKVAAVMEDTSSYDFHSNTGNHKSNAKPPELIPDTMLELLDLPPLPTDSDNQACLRIAVAGNGDDWNGAAIYSSSNDGEKGDNNFTPLTGIDTAATMGVIITDLASAPCATWDDSNTVEVILFSGSLISVNELALLNGANTAMIGDELIQFQNAELIGEQRYLLSRLLRGRQGTEVNIVIHEAGTRFVLLDSSLYTASMPSNMIGRTTHYKAVTVGNSVENTEGQAFTYHGNCLKPFAPVHITSRRDDSKNLTISWIRRSRVGSDWRDNVDIPLAEESEKYQVDILAGDTVVRTLEVSTPIVTYTAADQLADFKAIPNNINIRVYQMSAIIGRSRAAIAII